MQKSLLITLSAILIFKVAAAEISAVGFSNGDGNSPSALSVVVNAINNAHQSIYMASYSFTSKPVAEALITAKKRGVDVKIIADEKANNGNYTAVTTTANYGIPTRTIGRYKIFHNKFMIIDGNCVETGSFNYSSAAAKNNAENALEICDKELARTYTRQFNYWYNQGNIVKARY